jgi:site-specific recombinase XerD
LKEENEMSALRQRMNEVMVLGGFAERTRETYLACISSLARHYGRSPDTLDAAAIQAYLLLISERKLAYSSVNQAVCAIRFLFAVVLGQRGSHLRLFTRAETHHSRTSASNTDCRTLRT